MASTIAVSVLADTKRFASGMAHAGKSIDPLTSSLKKLAVAGAGLIGGAAIVGWTKTQVKSLARIDEINKQTQAVVKSTGGVARVSAKHVEDLAGSLENLTGTEAETTQKGANMLLTFTNISNGIGKGNDIFDQATKTLVDMSRALGSDPQKAAVQLGKALNDPIKGVTALSKVGVSFTAEQKAQIKTLVDSGKTMEAQKIILGELNKEFGGSGAAYAKSYAGMFTLLGHAAGTFGETLTAGLLPGIQAIVPQLTKFLNDISVAGGPVERFGKFIGQGVKALADFVAPLVAVDGPLGNLGAKASGAAGGFVTLLSNLSPLTQFIKALLPMLPGIVKALTPVAQAIGAQLGPVIQTLVQQLAPLLVSVLKTLGSTFASLLPQIAPLITILGTTFGQVLTTLAPVIGQVVATAGQLIQGLAPIIGQLAQQLAPVITVVAQAIGTLLGALGPVIQSLLPVISSLVPVVGVVANAIGALVPVLAPLITMLATTFVGVLKVLVPIIGQVVGVLSETLQPIFAALTPVIAVVVGVIGKLLAVIAPIVAIVAGALAKAFAVIAPIIGQVASILITALQPVFQALTPIIAGITPIIGQVAGVFVQLVSALAPLLVPIAKLVGSLLGPLAGLLLAVVPPVLTLVSTLITTLMPVIQLVINILATVIGWVAKLAAILVVPITAIIKLAGALAQGLIGTLTNVVKWAAGLVKIIAGVGQKLLKGLDGLVSGFFDIGRNIIQGLLKGAGSLLKNIGSFFLDILPGFIREPFKKALGIHSPSREFIENGKHILRGLLKGLSGAELSDVAARMGKVADLIKDAFSKKLITKATANSLTRYVEAQNKRLTNLAKARDKIAERIKAANELATGVKTGLVDAGSVTGGGRFADIQRQLQGTLSAANAFGKAFASLKKDGLNQTALQQLISQFTQDPAAGAASAKALLAGGIGGINQVNTLQKQIAAKGASLGKTLADSSFDNGKGAAKGFLTGLTTQQAALERQMGQLGKVLGAKVSAELQHATAVTVKRAKAATIDKKTGTATPKVSTPARASSAATGAGGQTVNIEVKVMPGAGDAATGRAVVHAVDAYFGSGGKSSTIATKTRK